jgi:hypothetical protein
VGTRARAKCRHGDARIATPLRIPRARRVRAAQVIVLTLLACLLLAVECRTPVGPRGAPEAPLVDPHGEPDPAALEGWVRRTEGARGLAFVRRPSLELVEPNDPRLAGSDAAALLFARAESDQVSAVPDFARDRIVTVRPVDLPQVRLALARLLDAQHYPRLPEAAEVLAGDPGRAVRALLDASAVATVRGGLGPAPDEPRTDPFADPVLDAGEPQPAPDLRDLLVLSAQSFLRELDDREAAFRSPPLSTEQILRPGRWRAGDRPVWLAGPPPALACAPERDESLGLIALLEALARRGGRLPSAALAGWRGDRCVIARCGEGASAWVYVIEHDDEAGAAAFGAEAPTLLAEILEGPVEVRRLDRRVVVWHAVSADAAIAFARGLEAAEVRSLEEALAFSGRGG